MKKISELGLELIELEDQVLLVDRKLGIKHIASTKPLEGLPLLVIEDEVNIYAYESDEYKTYSTKRSQGYREGVKNGFQKAKEIYKFTHDDLIKAVDMARKRDVDGCIEFEDDEIIQSITKKELWIDAYWDCCGRCTDVFDKCTATWELNIENNQIKATWK